MSRSVCQSVVDVFTRKSEEKLDRAESTASVCEEFLENSVLLCLFNEVFNFILPLSFPIDHIELAALVPVHTEEYHVSKLNFS